MICLYDKRVLLGVLVEVYLSLNSFQSLHIEVLVSQVIKLVYFAFEKFVVRILFIISPSWA